MPEAVLTSVLQKRSKQSDFSTRQFVISRRVSRFAPTEGSREAGRGRGGGGAGSHPWPMEWGWSMWTRFRVSEHNIGEHVMIKKRGARAAGGDRSKLVGRRYSKEVVFMHSSVA